MNYAMDSNAVESHTAAMNTAAPTISEALATFPRLDAAAFQVRLGAVVEHAPWVAQCAWAQAPFRQFEALYEAMSACILAAPREQQLTLLRGHPELAGREAQAGVMTPDSTAEQKRLGLMALSAETLARLTRLNREYAERFGYPLIVALRLHASLDSVLLSGEQRLTHSADTEWPIALQQVCEVMRGRLVRVVREVEASALDSSSLTPSSSPTLS